MNIQAYQEHGVDGAIVTRREDRDNFSIKRELNEEFDTVVEGVIETAFL